MKKIHIYILCVLPLMGCARSCESMNRGFQTGDRSYEVIMFSGGDTVFIDRFEGIINNSESSDGIYYYKHDTLVEVSGDYVIKSLK